MVTTSGNEVIKILLLKVFKEENMEYYWEKFERE